MIKYYQKGCEMGKNTQEVIFDDSKTNFFKMLFIIHQIYSGFFINFPDVKIKIKKATKFKIKAKIEE